MESQQALRVVVVDRGTGKFGQALIEALKGEFPTLVPHFILMTPPAAGDGEEDTEKELAADVREADVIIVPDGNGRGGRQACAGAGDHQQFRTQAADPAVRQRVEMGWG